MNNRASFKDQMFWIDARRQHHQLQYKCRWNCQLLDLVRKLVIQSDMDQAVSIMSDDAMFLTLWAAQCMMGGVSPWNADRYLPMYRQQAQNVGSSLDFNYFCIQFNQVLQLRTGMAEYFVCFYHDVPRTIRPMLLVSNKWCHTLCSNRFTLFAFLYLYFHFSTSHHSPMWLMYMSISLHSASFMV